jgi:hypothetical protein
LAKKANNVTNYTKARKNQDVHLGVPEKPIPRNTQLCIAVLRSLQPRSTSWAAVGGGLQCNDRRPVGFTDETVEDVQVFVLFLTPYRGLGIEQHRSSARRAEQAPLQYFLLFVFDEGKAKQEGTAP